MMAAPRPPKRFPEGRVPRQTEWASRHTGFPADDDQATAHPVSAVAGK